MTVPCGDCHHCCKRWAVVLRPEKGDRPSDYETEIFASNIGPVHVLKRKPNGDCIYLGERGCTIHDRAPFKCREFDCRMAFRMHDRIGRKLAVKSGQMPKAIFDRGRELLEGK